MSQVCFVCKHPMRKVIELAVVNGAQFMTISKDFGPSAGSISSHSKKCMGNSLAVLRSQLQVRNDLSVLEKVRSNQELLRAKYDQMVLDGKADMSAAEVMRETTRLMELEAKLCGQVYDKKKQAPQFKTAREMLDYTRSMIPLLEERAASEAIDVVEVKPSE